MNENYKVYQTRKQATKKSKVLLTQQVVQRTPPRQDEYNTTIE